MTLDVQMMASAVEHGESHGTLAGEMRPDSIDIDVYDFFSGCGGTSAGLKSAGLNPVMAVDFDVDALDTFAHNFPTAVPVLSDIRQLGTRDIEHLFDRDRRRPVLICACAPCQPFSKQNWQKKPLDKRASLLSGFVAWVASCAPCAAPEEYAADLSRSIYAARNPLQLPTIPIGASQSAPPRRPMQQSLVTPLRSIWQIRSHYQRGSDE